jgi:glycosyltransferase involved in cell wall biosynthesis
MDQNKILLLMPLAELRGGAEFALGQLLRRASKRRDVKCRAVFFQDGVLVEIAREAGVQAEVVPAGRLRQPVRFGRCVKRIARIAREAGTDVILSWMGKAQLYGGPAAMLAGVPAVWFQHGIPVGQRRMDNLATLLPAAGVLACSGHAAEAQRRLWPRRRTRVVYPPVDLERFDADRLPSPLEMRRQLGLPAGGPLIGMVGRLQRWKGFHVLVEAMPRILASQPEARCVLVGGEHAAEPDYANALKSQIEDLGMSDRITMVGLQQNVPQWMQAMDVIVHASDAEPFGMVVIEAMALGKPVVASASAGPTEIITPEVNGLLTPYGDAEALAAAVTRYLADTNFAARVGRAAHARARDFGAARFVDEVVDAVTEFAQSSSRRSRSTCNAVDLAAAAEAPR